MKRKILLSLMIMVTLTFAFCITNASAATYEKLTYKVSNGEVTITDCEQSASGELVIPKTIEGYPVTSIDEWAFGSCYALTNITIPDGVTSIGNFAFLDCTSLTNITIPDSVTSIGNWAFYYCISLTDVTIPDGVTSIGNSTFYYCSSLTDITIPGGVTSIENSTFCYCTSLTNITIPDSVTSIGDEAFYNCTSLTNIKIPNSVISIGYRAFASCESLTNIAIPDGLASIGELAFFRCSNLGEIIVDNNNQYYSSDKGILFNKDKTEMIMCPEGTHLQEYAIPNSVTSIGNSTFYSCDSLTKIIISDSVISIGESAFEDCTALTNIAIPDSVISIGESAFEDCTALTNITIPDSVTSIGGWAYVSCESLTNIAIPDSVTIIDEGTFEDCKSLASITIPNSVTSIGEWAFFYCNNLKDVYYTGSEADWEKISVGSYNSCLTNSTIHYNYVPVSTAPVTRTESKSQKIITILKNKNDMTKNSDDYVAWAPVKVTVDGNEYYVKADATVVLPKSGSAVVSAEGFIDLNVDLSKISNGETLYLEKSGMKTPVLFDVTIDGTDIRRSKGAATKGIIKANIDWNGNTESVVYIENGVSKWIMTNGQTREIDFAKEINPKRDISIVIKSTNGYVVKKPLHIDITADTTKYDNLNVSFGDSIKDINSGDIPYLDMKFNFDIPNFPCEISINGNKVKVIFGVDVAEWGYENKYYDGKKGEWTTKEKQNAFNSLSNIIKDTKKQMDKNKSDKKTLAAEYKELKKQLGKSQKVSTAKFGFDAKMSFVGYAEGTIDQNGLFLSDGGFIFSAEAAAGFSGQFTIWVVPFNWEAGIKGSIEAQLALAQRELREQALTPTGIISGSVALSAGVGPGMKKLHANLVGEGAIKPAYELSEIKNAFTLDAELGLSIEVVAWKFSKSFELAKKEFHLYPRAKTASLMSAEDFYNTSGYELIGRDYLANPSVFVANDRDASLMSVTPQTKTENIIKTNVYQINQPTMTEIQNGNKLLVWVDEDTGRSVINGTSLAYTYYDGTSWSDEQFVENDGTADFNPQLKNVNGTIYLVWENVKSALSGDADITDMAKATEIKYAVYNDETNKFTNITALTDNGYIDSDPQISFTTEGAVITWVQNTSDNIFTADNCHSISYALINSSGVIETKVAKANISAVDSHSAYIDNGVQIVYIADTDGNINTTDDNVLHTTSGTCNLEGIPSGVSEYFGRYYCYNNGVLSVSDDGYSFTDTPLYIPNDRFTVLDNGNMICYEQSEGATKDIYAYIYDEAQGKWSSSVRLTKLGANLRDISGFVDSYGDVHLAFNKANITGDLNENIDTLFGQYDLSTLKVSPSYNITLDDVYINAETIVENSPVEIEIDVTNNGEKTVDEVNVVLYDDGGNILQSSNIANMILPGETATLSISYVIPKEFNAFGGYVEVGLLSKTDYDNSDNRQEIVFDYVDLSIDSAGYSKNSDNTVLINAVISNLCLDTQNDIAVSLMDGENIIDTITIDSLNTLESESVSFNNVTPGKTYTLALSELEAENNIANNYHDVEVDLMGVNTSTEGYVKNVSYSSGTLTADIAMFNSCEDANAHVSVFDADGNLVALKSEIIPKASTEKQIEVQFSGTKGTTYRVRFMLWNNSLSPFMNADEKDLYIE